MLITFSTKSHADITMFDYVAEALLHMMGQSGAIPGAILAPDIAPALERLKAAVAESGHQPGPAAPGAQAASSDEETAAPVSLRQRAYPLIGLFEAALSADTDVTWAPTRNPLL
ncbi:MAG: DUF1840 domain-containing protein [Burkholderiales bacterium]|nr:DUF1840 domain-containing protein [Burkholderiales bacterium]